ALLAASGDVRAHRLEAEVVGIDLGRKAVTVYSYFETGDEPKEAGVKVYAADGRLLAEGKLDRKGAFTFTYERPEAMRRVVDAPGVHKAVCYSPAKRLGGADDGPPPSPAEGRSRVRDVLLGVGFLLALGAFVLGLRNARRLGRLEERGAEPRG